MHEQNVLSLIEQAIGPATGDDALEVRFVDRILVLDCDECEEGLDSPDDDEIRDFAIDHQFCVMDAQS